MKKHILHFIFLLNICLLALNGYCQDKGFTPANNNNNTNNRIGYKKIALVIGNNKYLDARNNLKNAKNDAEDISLALKNLGFEVTTLLDLPKIDFEKAVLDYTKKLLDAEIGLFYFSGHGFEANGENYLVPSDANLSGSTIAKTCVDLTFLFDNLERAGNPTNLIFLDACRSNLKLTTAETKIKGFTTPDPPSGSLVVYGTKIGKTASDNTTEKNGLFTGTLLKYLSKKELGIRQIVDKTGDDMAELSGGNQLPSRFDIMTTDYFLSKTPYKVDNATKLKHRKLMEAAFRLNINNDQKQALSNFKEANELIPQDTLSSFYAGSLLSVNNYEESNKYYLSSIKNGAKSYWLYYSISENYRRLKDFKNAITILKEALKLFPQVNDLHYFLIHDLINNKLIEEAIQYSKRFNEIIIDNKEEKNRTLKGIYILFLNCSFDVEDNKHLKQLVENEILEILNNSIKVQPSFWVLEGFGRFYYQESESIESKNSPQKCDFLKKTKYYYNRAITEYPKHEDLEDLKEELASIENSIKGKCK